MRTTLAILLQFGALLLVLGLPRAASADDRFCDGPQECCPRQIAPRLSERSEMSIGIVLVGLSNIDERQGSWDADYYLYEEWRPASGLTPQTEIANEIERHAVQFDSTEARDGKCLRSRRIRSTLRSDFNLRSFPFDEQKLVLKVSDDQFDSTQLAYRDQPSTLGVDDVVKQLVSGWKIKEGPSFVRESRAFKWEPGAPAYDYATFSLVVRRHVSFHLTRYFLPLLVIVAIAFAVFWIDPEDLNSQIAIGVTCVLAAIALQFAEGGTLPEVAYLTLEDRVYAICYVAIALAIAESIYTNSLVRRGSKATALKLDRRCRIAFPVGLLVALVGGAVRAFTMEVS
jgi:hypothetical protein